MRIICSSFFAVLFVLSHEFLFTAQQQLTAQKLTSIQAALAEAKKRRAYLHDQKVAAAALAATTCEVAKVVVDSKLLSKNDENNSAGIDLCKLHLSSEIPNRYNQLKAFFYNLLTSMPLEIIKLILDYEPYEVLGLCVKTLNNQDGSIDVLTVLPNGNLITSDDKGIKVWDQHTWKCTRDFKRMFVLSEAFDRTKLMCGSAFNPGNRFVDILCVDVVTQVCEKKFSLRFQRNLMNPSLAVLDNEHFIIGFDWMVHVIDIGSARVQKIFKDYGGEAITAFIASPEKQLIAGLANGTIMVWNLSSGRLEKKLIDHRSDGLQRGGWLFFEEFERKPTRHAVVCLMLLSEHTIASGARDGSITIWDFQKDTPEQILAEHTSSVCCLTKLQDGRFASGSQDKSIIFWTEKNGRWELAKMLKDDHLGGICALRQLPDGRLVSSDEDKTIKIWS